MARLPRRSGGNLRLHWRLKPPQSLWLGSYKTAEEAAVAAVNDAAWHNRNSWGFYFDQERRELVRLGGAAGG